MLLYRLQLLFCDVKNGYTSSHNVEKGKKRRKKNVFSFFSRYTSSHFLAYGFINPVNHFIIVPKIDL